MKQVNDLQISILPIRSHFHTLVKCDMLLNNLCKLFNTTIIEVRDKSILSLLEHIKAYLMKRMNARREYIGKWSGSICPNALKMLEKNKYDIRYCITSRASEWMFKVTCIYGDKYTVNLDTQSCACRRWDLTGIPC